MVKPDRASEHDHHVGPFLPGPPQATKKLRPAAGSCLFNTGHQNGDLVDDQHELGCSRVAGSPCEEVIGSGRLALRLGVALDADAFVRHIDGHLPPFDFFGKDVVAAKFRQ